MQRLRGRLLGGWSGAVVYSMCTEPNVARSQLCACGVHVYDRLQRHDCDYVHVLRRRNV